MRFTLSMTDTTPSGTEDWSAYWTGRGQAGEAFAGEGVETHPGLAAFWDGVFADAPGARVLDVACGAGSVLRRAHAQGLTHLTGVDASAAALRLLEGAVPGVRTAEAPADALPFETHAFDRVVSQFGFEYAGDAAAGEMARVLAPGGRLVALVHMTGGLIEREVAAQAAAADAVAETGFVPAARALIEAEFAYREGRASEAAVRGVQAAFDGPQRALFAAVQGQGQAGAGGIAQHLYEGFRQLYQRQQAYDLADITGWLGGMEAELAAFRGRMVTMRAAARDEAAMADTARRLEEAGLEAEVAPFALDGDEAPSAWRLTASRQ